MDVFIICEFSGVVRQAFRERGHNAVSCDLLSAEDNSPYHIQGDAMKQLALRNYDLVIAHWPCTFTANSGVRWLYNNDGTKNLKRWAAMYKAAHVFEITKDIVVTLKGKKLAMENPIPHKYARAIMGKYTQIIQPWQFGHPETKATCLWLYGLPLLQPTDIVNGRKPRVHYESPGPDRWKNRSRTLKGIADAMAKQWG